MSESLLKEKITNRKLKVLLKQYISSSYSEGIDSLLKNYRQKALTSLLSVSYDENSEIRFGAIELYSKLTGYLNHQDKNSVRIFIRKLIWMLTEESGGIAWTAPAIIGVILSADVELAAEFADILFSYVYEVEGEPENFLDHPPHREMAYWGIYKLLSAFPEMIFEREYIIESRFTVESDSNIQAILCLICEFMLNKNSVEFLKTNLNNEDIAEIYFDGKIKEVRIKGLALSILQDKLN